MKKIVVGIQILLFVVFSSLALSADPPSVPSPFYDNGPQSPLLATTDMSAAERAAYALLEAVVQIAEAKIHATSCNTAVGSSTVEIFTDGTIGSTNLNYVDVVSLGGSYTLGAELQPSAFFRGQKINVDQKGFGLFGGTLTLNYLGRMTVNYSGNMMTGYGRVDMMGINGFTTRYDSKIIKDYNRGSTDNTLREYYTLNHWGLQAQEKLGFPVNKYWQRFKSRHSDGEIGRTVFIADRLVGATACRIEINLEGENNQDYFWQVGTLVISTDTPVTPVTAFGSPFFVDGPL